MNIREFAKKHVQAVSIVVLGLVLVIGLSSLGTLKGKYLKYLSSSANSSIFSASPNPIPVCDDSGVGTTTLSWNTPTGTPVEVRKDGEAGPVVVQATGSGSQAVSNVEDGTTYYLYATTTTPTLKHNKKTQKWERGSITEKKLSALLHLQHTDQGCGEQAEGMTVTPATQTITPGQSYQLTALLGSNPFQGLVAVESVVCELSNPTQCRPPAVYDPWIEFNPAGTVTVPTRATIPPGIYKARIRPAGQPNAPWSNEFSIQVNPASPIIPFHVPARIMSGSLSSELATSGNIYAPEILYEDGIYKMWYGGQGQDGSDRIHMATSTDGLSWAKLGVVVDNDDSTHVNDPSVVKVGGTYYMYYTDAKPVIFDRIYLATSTDGQHWSKQGMVLDKGSEPWNNYIVGRPSVLYEGGQWKMWFDTISLNPQYPQRYVGYATSTNGRTWKIKSDYVFTGGAVDVKKVGDKYIMLQEWQQGTLIAVSSDGITWTDKGTLFSISGTDFDRFGQVTPFLLLNHATGKPQAIYFGGAEIATWNHNNIGIYRLEGTELDQYTP